MSGKLEKKDELLLLKHADLPVVDTSTRRLFKTCARKSAWMAPAPFGLGLRPKQTAPALRFGTLIHEALDGYYATAGGPLGREDPATEFAIAADKQIAEAQNQGKLIRPNSDQVAGLLEMRDLGVRMLEEYAAWAPHNDDFEVKVTERGVVVPLFPQQPIGMDDGRICDAHNPVALYYARFDGIVEDDRGRLWVMEHKTTKRWWDPTMLALDEQIAAYAWVAEQWYGKPVAGVLMNFLLKEAVRDPFILKNGLPTTDWSKLTYVTPQRYNSAIGSRKPTDKEAETYLRICNRDIENGHPTIRRVKVELTRERIEAQGARILRDTLRMLDPDRPGVDDPTPTFLCKGCPMREPCELAEEGSDYEWALKHGYEERMPLWMEADENGGNE